MTGLGLEDEPTEDERGDLVWPCGCYRFDVGGGSAWMACSAHGGGCGASVHHAPAPLRAPHLHEHEAPADEPGSPRAVDE